MTALQFQEMYFRAFDIIIFSHTNCLFKFTVWIFQRFFLCIWENWNSGWQSNSVTIKSSGSWFV